MSKGGLYVLDRYTFGTGGDNDRKDVDLIRDHGEACRCVVVTANTATGGGNLYFTPLIKLDDGAIAPAGKITLGPSETFRVLYSDGVLVAGFSMSASAASVIGSVVASRGYPPLTPTVERNPLLTANSTQDLHATPEYIG